MKIIPILFVLLINVHLQSQNQIGLVKYGHKQSLGMGAPIGIDYNANLIFNSENSLYIFAQDSLEGGRISESVLVRKDKDNFFVQPKNTSQLGFQYYNDLKNKKFFSRDIGFRYVKETTPFIKWEISNDTKDIGNFKCTKALGNFRGREYTAWFTTTIPLPYGPWKLQGLPGLILEAYDTNKEIYFYFKSVKYPIEIDTKVTKPNPKDEDKDWIEFSEYSEALINAHKRAIENGRMAMEQFDSENTSQIKNSMGNSYIEIFGEK